MPPRRVILFARRRLSRCAFLPPAVFVPAAVLRLNFTSPAAVSSTHYPSTPQFNFSYASNSTATGGVTFALYSGIAANADGSCSLGSSSPPPPPPSPPLTNGTATSNATAWINGTSINGTSTNATLSPPPPYPPPPLPPSPPPASLSLFGTLLRSYGGFSAYASLSDSTITLIASPGSGGGVASAYAVGATLVATFTSTGASACARVSLTADVAAAFPGLQLQFAWVQARHGVRSPFGPFSGSLPPARLSPEVLAQYTTRAWPAQTSWGISVADYDSNDITGVGEAAVLATGAWAYQKYATSFGLASYGGATYPTGSGPVRDVASVIGKDHGTESPFVVFRNRPGKSCCSRVVHGFSHCT